MKRSASVAELGEDRQSLKRLKTMEVAQPAQATSTIPTSRIQPNHDIDDAAMKAKEEPASSPIKAKEEIEAIPTIPKAEIEVEQYDEHENEENEMKAANHAAEPKQEEEEAEEPAMKVDEANHNIDIDDAAMNENDADAGEEADAAEPKDEEEEEEEEVSDGNRAAVNALGIVRGGAADIDEETDDSDSDYDDEETDDSDADEEEEEEEEVTAAVPTIGERVAERRRYERAHRAVSGRHNIMVIE